MTFEMAVPTNLEIFLHNHRNLGEPASKWQKIPLKLVLVHVKLNLISSFTMNGSMTDRTKLCHICTKEMEQMTFEKKNLTGPTLNFIRNTRQSPFILFFV